LKAIPYHFVVMGDTLAVLDDELYETPSERWYDLEETLNTSGWLQIAQPQLTRRVAKLERRIAQGRARSLEELRLLQGQYQALSEILADPRKFFLGRTSTEESTD
jgi:hypothetical protein